MARISTEVRRQQLTAAAVTALMRDGVANASLRTIAADAGASLGAVHVCFASKDELISGAIEGFLEETWLRVRQDAAQADDLRAACYQILDGFWSAITLNPLWAVAQFEIGMWSLRERDHHGIIRQIYNQYEERIVDVISAATHKAGQKLRLPPTQIARALLAITDGCGLQYLADPISHAHRELATMMVDSLVERSLSD